MAMNGTDPTPGKTAVIIPYYQEEPGILREAVLSAIAQEGVSGLEIIIVDDGSPAPARDDLHGLDLPAHVTIRLIEQQNRGPGAARNRGLDSVRPDTAYIALLDSDDTWSVDHLWNAQTALSLGYDFYFSDYEHSDSGETVFSSRGAEMFCEARLITPSPLYALAGDCTLCTLYGCIALPTVVYKRELIECMRFPEKFRVGEDRAFILGLAQRQGLTVAFSPSVECCSRSGLHVFKNSRWGSPKAIWALTEWVISKKWISENIELGAAAKEIHAHDIERIRRSFILSVLHQAKACSLRCSDVFRYIRSDPAVITRVAPVVKGVLMGKAKAVLLSCWIA